MEQNFLITGINRVIWVGGDEYPEKRSVFTDQVTSNELILTLSGEATVYFNGKVLHDAENTIRFLPKGPNFEYIVDRQTYGEGCIDIFFDADRPIAKEAFTLKLSDNKTVHGLFKKLFSVWVGKNEGYYFECISLLYKIFAELQKQNYIPENQYRAIKPAADYIEEHFRSEKIAAEKLAALCGISYSYLKKLFIRRYGVPPLKYALQMKMNYACDLLLSGLYTITQTAERCGYSDPAFFSRQFKAYMGISPSTFIEKYKSSK